MSKNDKPQQNPSNNQQVVDQNQQLSQPQPQLSETTTVEQTAVAQTVDSLSADEVQSLKLLGEVLGEYGTAAGFHVDMRQDSGKVAMSKLHQAFRVLFTLRGNAFKQGFATLIEAVNGCKTKAYHPKIITRHLELFNDQDEAGVFVTFIHYATRFARMGNKAKFSQSNDISRLTSRIIDQELVSAINEAFLVNQ